MLERLIAAIKTYATTHEVPLIEFERRHRKNDVVADPSRAPADGRCGGDWGGARKIRAFSAHKRAAPHGGVTFSRRSVNVNHYYFSSRIPSGGRPS
jgi:hypothetical protein